MRDEEIARIAVAAIKIEASRKPDERIYIGDRVFTFLEIAEAVDRGDPFIVEKFLQPFLERLKKSEAFRMKVLKLVGGT